MYFLPLLILMIHGSNAIDFQRVFGLRGFQDVFDLRIQHPPSREKCTALAGFVRQVMELGWDWNGGGRVSYEKYRLDGMQWTVEYGELKLGNSGAKMSFYPVQACPVPPPFPPENGSPYDQTYVPNVFQHHFVEMCQSLMPTQILRIRSKMLSHGSRHQKAKLEKNAAILALELGGDFKRPGHNWIDVQPLDCGICECLD